MAGHVLWEGNGITRQDIAINACQPLDVKHLGVASPSVAADEYAEKFLVVNVEKIVDVALRGRLHYKSTIPSPSKMTLPSGLALGLGGGNVVGTHVEAAEADDVELVLTEVVAQIAVGSVQEVVIAIKVGNVLAKCLCRASVTHTTQTLILL